MRFNDGKDMDWRTFEAEDDLTNIRDIYSFVSLSKKKDKRRLLRGFMANEAMRSFFTR